jgi:hypothetical protein
MNTRILPQQPADYDRQFEFELAEKIATVIGKNSIVDGVLVLRPAETTNALIANLGFALSRSPAAVEGLALARTLDAVGLRLVKHIAAALRVAARNHHSNNGGRA